jgi:hypothetical protein
VQVRPLRVAGSGRVSVSAQPWRPRASLLSRRCVEKGLVEALIAPLCAFAAGRWESSRDGRARNWLSRRAAMCVGWRRRARSWQRHSGAGAAGRAEAVVARPGPAGLDVSDCDSAPALLGARLRASTITSCVGTGRTEGRCDLDHPVVAWPGVAVISSLPAPALLPFVLNGSGPSFAKARERSGELAPAVGDGRLPLRLWKELRRGHD